MKKFLLTAVNAQFIHSNPAVYSLRSSCTHPEDVDILEMTINDRYQDLLAGILRKVRQNGTKVIGLSCYIWNSRIMQDLAADLRTVLGSSALIFAGGPEASYAPELFLDSCDFVICWEGERAFRRLAALLNEAGRAGEVSGIIASPSNIACCLPGTARRTEDGQILTTPVEPETSQDIDQIPFLYDQIEKFEHRIIYYESSRGCPFRCSYCLSSIDRSVQFRSLETVKKELQFFIDQRIPQVKFVDRTFNCNHARAQEIWTYLRDHDNGVTNFHFEISADLLNEEELTLLSSLRPALVQLEIGIQSTNPETITAIRRRMDLSKLTNTVAALRRAHNINLHVDLIAGLPYENYEQFAKSFDDVYALHADQLQLGFLKVLRGTYMHAQAQNYQLRYSQRAPYEILSTAWLSYAELDSLHRICDVLDLYYNSQQFIHALAFIEPYMGSPFRFYEKLADFFKTKGYDKQIPSTRRRYEILQEFAALVIPSDRQPIFKEYLRLDQMLHIHKSRRMIEKGRFDFGDGEVWIEVDHSHENPLNHEAAWRICDNA